MSDDLRRRFRALDHVPAPDLWPEIADLAASPQPHRRVGQNLPAAPVMAAIAALVVVAGLGALTFRAVELRVGSAGPDPVDAPFSERDAQALGLQPGDVPDTGYQFDGLESRDEELDDAAWQAHLDRHGLRGRWWASLIGREVLLGSRVSIWKDDAAARAALDYESSRRTSLRGRPAGPLTPANVGDEGWCQLLLRGPDLQDESFCRFRVANATIDLYARPNQDGEGYSPGTLESVARKIAERSQALAATSDTDR